MGPCLHWVSGVGGALQSSTSPSQTLVHVLWVLSSKERDHPFGMSGGAGETVGEVFLRPLLFPELGTLLNIKALQKLRVSTVSLLRDGLQLRAGLAVLLRTMDSPSPGAWRWGEAAGRPLGLAPPALLLPHILF